MTKIKEIEIATIEQFFNVATDDNFERLMNDFILFAILCMKAKSKHPDLQIVSMHWTDDSKNEITGIILNGDKIIFKKP
jgi:hypothetical protein